MYQFGPSQQTTTAKAPLFFLKFKKRVHELSVNETKPDTENASNCNYVGFGVNNATKQDKSAMFRVTLQNCDLYFNPQTADNVVVRF